MFKNVEPWNISFEMFRIFTCQLLLLIGVSFHDEMFVQKNCLLTLFYEVINTSVETDYYDVIVSAMAAQITSLAIVYSAVYSGENQRKHQSTAKQKPCVYFLGYTVFDVKLKSDYSIRWKYNCVILIILTRCGFDIKHTEKMIEILYRPSLYLKLF